MKKEEPTPEMVASVGLMSFIAVLAVLLALIPWETQDFIASFAATEMTTVTTLRTMEERDDTRVLRAFAEAKRTQRVNAELVTEPNPKQQTRDAVLTVRAATKAETLAGREAMVNAMRAAFANEGPGELFDHGNAPYAKPMPNAAMATIKRVCNGVSVAFLLGGLVLIVKQWRRLPLPKVAILGILASVGTLLLTGEHEGGAIIVPIFLAAFPIIIIALVTRMTLRVRKAKTWVEGRARITKSKVEIQRHRFQGGTTTLKNKAAVEYDFAVGEKTIHGDRISVGDAPADNVDGTMKRYPVGANAAVFYDPANPEDCVLERDPPASLGCIWTGTAVVVLVYVAVVWSFWNSRNIITHLGKVFTTVFPKLHHPFIVIGAGLAGLFCLASGIWNRRHQRKAFPWLPTKGIIVSSTVESYVSSAGDSKSQRTSYKAVIEFRYMVDGQEYHNTAGESGGSQSSAEAEVARWPEGTEVEVHYDPKKPTASGLEVDTEMMLTGRHSFVVAFVLLAVAIYAALN